MNIVRKIILFIKNIFNNQSKVEKIEDSKNTIEQNKKENFMESLKTTNTEKGKKIETLICEGDGLGIQKRIIS